MASIGTTVTNTETPAATTPVWDTANAFMIGFSDWGSTTGPITITSQPQIQSAVGPRSGTNTTLYDSLDVFFREGGTTAFVSRVVGPSASAASLVLSDSNPSAAVLVNAAYVGEYGNAIKVAVVNNGTSVQITLTDTYGNTLAVSPALSSRAAIVSWAATSGYVTAVAYVGTTLPATATATLSNGSSNKVGTTLASYSTALSNIPAALGPGQVLAPGITNTSVSGIWTALGAHALANNRVAICDVDDGVSANVAVSDISTTYQTASSGPIGFWAGNLSAPGVVPNTTRSIPPSAVISALCSLVDAAGNPNLAAAGSGLPLQYCTGPATVVTGTNQTYSPVDTSTLNSAGINTFASFFGGYLNWGFVSSIPSTTDVIYWQFNHCRLRMAITASVQIVAQPFVFSQIDGQGSDILSFGSALANMLKQDYWASGALYGVTPNDAFSVNVGPQVNPPSQLQQGVLSAVISVKMSPFAQQIPITINSVPITGTL